MRTLITNKMNFLFQIWLETLVNFDQNSKLHTSWSRTMLIYSINLNLFELFLGRDTQRRTSLVQTLVDSRYRIMEEAARISPVIQRDLMQRDIEVYWKVRRTKTLVSYF